MMQLYDDTRKQFNKFKMNFWSTQRNLTLMFGLQLFQENSVIVELLDNFTTFNTSGAGDKTLLSIGYYGQPQVVYTVI